MQPTSQGPIFMSHDNLCGQPISRVIVSPLYKYIKHYYPKLVNGKTPSLVDTGKLAAASQSGHRINVT